MAYDQYLVNQNITSYTTISVYVKTTDDATNNRTRVQLEMKINGSNYSASGLSAGMTGASDRASSSWRGSGTVLSSDFYVNHNNDGTGSVTIAWWMNTTSGNSLPFGSTTLTLTTYPRASTPSVSSNVIIPNVDGSTANKYTIYTNRASSNFTHTITVTINGDGKGDSSGAQTVTVGTAKGVGDSVAFIPTVDLYKSFRYSKSVSGYVTCTTYQNGTQVGSAKTCAVTFSTSNNDGTTLSSTTITENNQNIASKSTSITLQTISRKTVVVHSSAHNYAHTVSVACNGVVLKQDSSDSTKWSGYLTNLTSGTYTFTATDSRGWVSTLTVNQTYYAYKQPQITSMSLVRASQTSNTGTLSVSATYTEISGYSQAFNTYYERAVDGSWGSTETITPTAKGGILTYSKSYDGSSATNALYYTKTYQVKIEITDTWGGYCTQTVTLGQGTSPLWIGKTDARIGGSLTIGSNLEVGSASSGSLTAVSNSYGAIQNATWRRMGRVVVFRLEYKLTATLPAYATVKIAKGLPAPSVACRCNGAFVDEAKGQGFVEISPSGEVTLYHRLNSTLASGLLYRVYGAVYIQ